jgi:hypothetical protein
MRQSILFVLMILVLCACQNDKRKLDKSQQLSTDRPEAKISFRCETEMNDETGPSSQVFLVIDEQATKVADIQACDQIAPEAYQQHKMPSNALAACGGWWAGGGQYLYAVQLKDNIVVFQGFQEEGQDDEGYHYEQIASVSLPE